MRVSTYELFLPLVGEKKNQTQDLTLSLAGPVSRLTEKDRKTIMETRSQKEMMNILEKTGFTFKKEK